MEIMEFDSGTFMLSQDCGTYLLYVPNQGDSKLSLNRR